jgi:hypothetical protein
MGDFADLRAYRKLMRSRERMSADSARFDAANSATLAVSASASAHSKASVPTYQAAKQTPQSPSAYTNTNPYRGAQQAQPSHDDVSSDSISDLEDDRSFS